MPPYTQEAVPVALSGEAVRADPSDATYEVTAVEQMAEIGPVDFGSAGSGSEATESGSNIIELDSELEMEGNQLGQFWINPLSRVEVEVRQTGNQDQRFVNSNQVGVITPSTPLNQRQVFVHEKGVPRLIVRNPQTWDMAKTLVGFTGFKLVLGDELSEADVQEMRGTPAGVPTDSLKQTTGRGR